MKIAKELFDELNSWDENRRIEAKSASAVGKSMMETVCAFANEPGLRGGYLLLGAKRTGMTEDGKPVYEPENIENTDKVQSIASWILRLHMPVHAWRFISFAILDS